MIKVYVVIINKTPLEWTTNKKVENLYTLSLTNKKARNKIRNIKQKNDIIFIPYSDMIF